MAQLLGSILSAGAKAESSREGLVYDAFKHYGDKKLTREQNEKDRALKLQLQSNDWANRQSYLKQSTAATTQISKTQNALARARDAQAQSASYNQLLSSQKFTRSFWEEQQSRYERNYEAAGLPKYLASAGASVPRNQLRVTQLNGGANPYTAKLAGDPTTSKFTGSFDQQMQGWGNILGT